jgi:methylenetetrahydrofolate reductase (NADPH)
MSRCCEALERGEFVVTGEVAPPLGTDMTAMMRSVEVLGPVTHALNVTDNQGATLHLSSLAASRAVLEAGFEPIFQQTCRDRNRLALQSDLLAASTLGLENVLIVTG